MNTEKQILEKAKWGNLSSVDIKLLGYFLENPDEADLYTVIHAVGKAELIQYQDRLEKFLISPNDPLISAITIRVLCGYWELTEQYIDIIVEIIQGVEWDEDEDVKLEALNVIGSYLFEHKDPYIFGLIIGILEDEDNFNAVRSAAYTSLGRAFGRSRNELPPASRPMNFDTDVDPSIILQAKAVLPRG